jgi:hypothetical protein
MMKKLTLFTLLLTGIMAIAQEEAQDSTKHWTRGGNISFLLNQSTFDNWMAGGENNFSGNLGLNYDFNYKKDDWTWDNKIIAEYGIVKTKNAEFEKKTNDRLEFNSVLGKKASEFWYYSFFLNFRTQFTDGYNYTKVDGVEVRGDAATKFMSPGYLTFGPGMLWKKSDDLKVNLAPATSKITFVNKDYTSVPGYVDGSYFGVDAEKTMRYELGFYASGYYKFKAMENVSIENILNLYSNYLEDPQNVDVDYQLNVVMTINKYLSANLSFQTIYDDNAFRGFQTRQVFGVGVNYGF